uniref:Maturase K n=1 Tax=Mucuna pruriens TaxID=157652 RepID=A0A872ZPQ1_MUCPR|nr:maturase K [Mucuna pruriens]QOY46344.1 maturase K [Mucuna pruriens]
MIDEIVSDKNIQIPNPTYIKPLQSKRSSWKNQRKSLFFFCKEFFQKFFSPLSFQKSARSTFVLTSQSFYTRKPKYISYLIQTLFFCGSIVIMRKISAYPQKPVNNIKIRLIGPNRLTNGMAKYITKFCFRQSSNLRNNWNYCIKPFHNHFYLKSILQHLISYHSKIGPNTLKIAQKVKSMLGLLVYMDRSWSRPNIKMTLPKIDKIVFPFIYQKRSILSNQNGFSLISNIMHESILKECLGISTILNRYFYKMFYFFIEKNSLKKNAKIFLSYLRGFVTLKKKDRFIFPYILIILEQKKSWITFSKKSRNPFFWSKNTIPIIIIRKKKPLLMKERDIFYPISKDLNQDFQVDRIGYSYISLMILIYQFIFEKGKNGMNCSQIIIRFYDFEFPLGRYTKLYGKYNLHDDNKTFLYYLRIKMIVITHKRIFVRIVSKNDEMSLLIHSSNLTFYNLLTKFIVITDIFYKNGPMTTSLSVNGFPEKKRVKGVLVSRSMEFLICSRFL